MEALVTYRGRAVTEADVRVVREMIAARPGASRRALSKELCAKWGWVQQNGAPRDMVCRGLLLALHRAGQIELPATRWVPPNPLARRTRPKPVEVDRASIRTTLKAVKPLTFRQVRRTADEQLFNGLVEMHHYLGYAQPVGEHLKFLVFSGERPVACFAWSSAPRHLGPRDRFIGWSPETRRQNIRYVAYNSRYLILPWVEVPHLASHLLGRMARMLSEEWEKVYGHPVYLVETFVHAERFKGTCYRAANWMVVGRTTGRGKDDRWHRGPNRAVKDVLCYPLVKDFRERLTRVA
ncbi:MAG: DUF4338 domain-containing protein [Verrucomicrobia bacterium]|nr:DUF4338 domain-containing protein [Verrucomicrobiota bacterium]